MARLDFTCPKCGEESIAEVPPGGIRVECPSCGAGLRLNAPGEVPEKKAPKRVKGFIVDDEQEATDRPRKKKRKKSTSSGGIPAWAWAAGGGGLVVVIALILVLTLGKGEKPDDQAASDAKSTAPPAGQNLNASGTPAKPPKRDPTQKDLPHRHPPKPTPPTKDSVAGSGAAIDQDWPELPARKRRQEPGDAPSRTIVHWSTPANGGGSRVVLDAPTEPVPPRPGPHRCTLARELARQAVLLAAREEFGASTRDAALGESSGDLTEFMPVANFELTWLAIPGQSAKATLAAVEGLGRREVWNLDIPLPDQEVLDYLALASALETAARGPLADALARETKSPRLSAKGSDPNVPPEAVAKLSEVNYFDLMAAVRQLHAAARAAGGSSTLLTDLSRGYAVLGLTTEHLDVPSQKIFKARALLYAHRAVARGARDGKWAVAYSACLAGLHGRALELVRVAGGNPPGWAKVIDPACRYDYTALKALPPAEVGPVAGVLRFIAAENNYTPSHPIGIGLEFLHSNRDCFRVYDGVTRIAGLGLVRSMTDAAPGVLSSALANRLAK